MVKLKFKNNKKNVYICCLFILFIIIIVNGY